jgi:hypothetical protein
MGLMRTGGKYTLQRPKKDRGHGHGHGGLRGKAKEEEEEEEGGGEEEFIRIQRILQRDPGRPLLN